LKETNADGGKGMIVYLVIIEDRHSDVDIEVWLDETKAIERGKSLALEYANGNPNELEEYLTTPMIESGWLYNVTYSCEGDSISVQKKETK
jgi:hypothetical protein